MSQSARIYAQQARREGFEVLVVDAFADADTIEAAYEVWQLPALGGQLSAEHVTGLLDKLDAWQAEGLLIGSGFENNLACYERLYQRCPLSGNSPDVIAQVKDPFWLNHYCETHGVMTPAVSSQMPEQGRWLSKVAGQSGGVHISDWVEQPASNLVIGSYWQAFQAGQAVGALFLAIQQSVTLIGIHALHQRQGTYTYAGASRLHEPPLIEAMQEVLNALIPDLGLVGINSLDAIWQDGRLHVLEINPRLSASMRLYAELPLIMAHIASCQGAETPVLKLNTMHASHCILYARQAMDAESLDFPLWLEDRPKGGNIAAGQPLCSLFAEGHSRNEVLQVLQDRKTQLENIWGTYVCEQIEFNIH